MKHKHHIIPKHMGGTDDPSNIVEVSVEEHANLHLDLYFKYGHVQDWVASQVLSGQMGKEELQLERSKLGARHPNVRSAEANKKRSEKLMGRTFSLSHIERKVKSASKQRKITDEQLMDVRKMRAEGEPLRVIAEKYDTSTTTINRYLNNKVRGAN